MEAEARAILEAGVATDSPDLVSQLRGLAEALALSDTELATVFPERRTETQRSVALGDAA